MILLYRTSSKKFVREFEGDLVDYSWYDNDNATGGGGGPLKGSKFYLYIVRNKAR